MRSDTREAWTCPYCLEAFQVLAGRDHGKDHAPHCPALLVPPVQEPPPAKPPG